jgi:hypothetical protein
MRFIRHAPWFLSNKNGERCSLGSTEALYIYRGATASDQGEAVSVQYVHESNPTNLAGINTMEIDREDRDRSKTDKEGGARTESRK